ncbi:MAG: glycine betaine ABC transporter substrate-binding protein [Thermodesulfobacteriota bacterium]|nr:glycine betaine ABC transporter substrate-binding protein [Thermodesulfobacteriota bacterium]
MKNIVITLFLILLLCIYSNRICQAEEVITIGSKKFTESVILGELVTQLARSKYPRVAHRKELGGTRLLWGALLNGEIDLYPEYTGTIVEEILAQRGIEHVSQLSKILNEYNIKMSKPLGFNNTYAFGMRKKVAEQFGIKNISDLRAHPELKFGFTNEFMNRGDGWPSVQKFYQLPHQNVRGLDHDVAYRGLESGAIDLIDVYSTDAEIYYYNLHVLHDDLQYFPEYHAVLLYRDDLTMRAPEVLQRILKLEKSISEQNMVSMNAKVKIEDVSDNQVAADFLAQTFKLKSTYEKETFSDRLFRNTIDHLFLVVVSLTLAILISIPFGIVSFFYEKIGHIILGIVGIIQTIPSLALIVFMIPLLGIGATPAIVALFLYSLLPIVRNTYTGLHDIPNPICESAKALGLSSFACLRLVELPMASRSIIAGIKTSAVINVGTATLGALIGAGGYGQPILTGIRLDNIQLILEGAIPAALLALLVQGFLELLDTVFVPKGLRIKAE